MGSLKKKVHLVDMGSLPIFLKLNLDIALTPT